MEIAAIKRGGWLILRRILEFFIKKKMDRKRLLTFLGGVEISVIKLDFDDFEHLNVPKKEICPDKSYTPRKKWRKGLLLCVGGLINRLF